MSLEQMLRGQTLQRRARLGLAVRAPVVPRAVLVQAMPPPTIVAAPVIDDPMEPEPDPPPRPGLDRKTSLPATYENLRRVVEYSAEVASVTSSDIMGRGHRRPLVHARHVATWVAYQALHRISTERLGSWLGRHHSTVVHGLHKVRNRYNDYEADVMAVMTKLGIEHGPDRLAKD